MSAVLDLVRERRPPFSPEAVVAEFAEVLKSYGIHEVVGDTYGGEWPRERFLTYGIHYRVAAKTKSEIFQSALPMLNSERVELLDNKMLHTQLVGLERRTSRGGKDSIDHRPGGRDDVVNAAAGVLTLCVPTIPITPDCFARGVISFGRPDTEEHRRLYDCAKNNKTALYPRSGNTYLRLLIRSAFDLRTHTLYGSGDRRSFGATPGLLEAVGHIDDGLESQALINVAKASDHIHFVKTHEEPLTDDPAIYIVRDGRSAIVSYWHFLNEVERVYISMEAVIEGNVYAGSWSQHYANWNPETTYMRTSL